MIIAGVPFLRTVLGSLDGETDADAYTLCGSPPDTVIAFLQLTGSGVVNSSDVDIPALLIDDSWSIGTLVYLKILAGGAISGPGGPGGRSAVYEVVSGSYNSQGGGGGGGQGDAGGAGGEIVTNRVSGTGVFALAGSDGSDVAAGGGGQGDNTIVRPYAGDFPGGSIDGGQGGVAIKTLWNFLLDNAGTIRSGGGGGGGGGSNSLVYYEPSGAGGAGGPWGTIGNDGGEPDHPLGEGYGIGGDPGWSIDKNGKTVTKIAAGTITGPENA